MLRAVKCAFAFWLNTFLCKTSRSRRRSAGCLGRLTTRTTLLFLCFSRTGTRHAAALSSGATGKSVSRRRGKTRFG